jgi:hypothetical protein
MQEKEADPAPGGRFKAIFHSQKSGFAFDGLSLDEVEDILNIWKLRGPHGG